MWALLFDRRIFNYVIMALYVVNASRWSLARSWGDAAYWVCAFGITASVTWGMKHE